MKRLIPILFLLIACSNSQIKLDSSKVDSVGVVRTAADSVQIKIYAEKDRIADHPELLKNPLIRKYIGMLDSSLKLGLLFKDSAKYWKQIDVQLKELNEIDNKAIDELGVLKHENERVKQENHKLNELYKVSGAEVVKEKKENEKLKKKLIEPTISSATVKCYGYKVRRFRSPLEFETNNAKDIKRIIIRFEVPANQFLDENKVYHFKVSIGTILSKPIHMKLTGEGIRLDDNRVVFDISDLLKAGEYPVTIEIENEVKYSTNLILK